MSRTFGREYHLTGVLAGRPSFFLWGGPSRARKEAEFSGVDSQGNRI